MKFRDIAERLMAAGWQDWGNDEDPNNDIRSWHLARIGSPYPGSSYGDVRYEVSLLAHNDGSPTSADIHDHGYEEPKHFYADDQRSDEIATRVWRALLRRDPQLSSRKPRTTKGDANHD